MDRARLRNPAASATNPRIPSKASRLRLEVVIDFAIRPLSRILLWSFPCKFPQFFLDLATGVLADHPVPEDAAFVHKQDRGNAAHRE